METVVEKLARASAAMRVGEMQQARSLYEEAIGDAPDNVEAWLGLAGLVGSPDDKRACFELALRLDPANRYPGQPDRKDESTSRRRRSAGRPWRAGAHR